MLNNSKRLINYNNQKSGQSSLLGLTAGIQQQQQQLRLRTRNRRKLGFLFCFCIFTLIYIVYNNTETLEFKSLSSGPPFSGASVNHFRTTTSKIAKVEPRAQENEDDDFNELTTTAEEDEISCRLPILNPFHSSILKFVQHVPKLDCTRNNTYPFLFTTDLESNLVPVQDPKTFGYYNCCYKGFRRKSEDRIEFTKTCHKINNLGQKIKIQPEHEFIAVFCNHLEKPSLQLVDMFGFIPPPNMTNKQHQQQQGQAIFGKNVTNESNLNVIILGLDAVSHMNFHRTMPKTLKYLVQNLSAISMNGYTKVGDNTFPNIVPAMMGVSVVELNETCWDSTGAGAEYEYFDECPFIWKNFSSLGYSTSYAEDSTWMGIFNYEKRGFNHEPTDYYLRTLTHQLEGRLGHTKTSNADLCYGPRLGFSILLKNIQNVAHVMQQHQHKYFQFTWATSLFHDELNNPAYGDKKLLETIQWFVEQNYLENSIFVLMSDHGMRWGEIRSTFQGSLEERMPLLYFILPPWFSKRYGAAVQNLRSNSNKLTTPYDMYETLKDLLDLKVNLNDDTVNSRSAKLENADEDGELPRGISLFLPVPASRNCSTASIDEHWCVCRTMESMPNNTALALSATHAIISIFNTQVLKEFKQCVKLELDTILHVQQLVDSFSANKGDLAMLTLTFVTKPGNAIFEVTAIKREIENSAKSSSSSPSKPFSSTTTSSTSSSPRSSTNEEIDDEDERTEWSLAGDVSRINLYGNDSHCVSNYNVKKYCYCL